MDICSWKGGKEAWKIKCRWETSLKVPNVSTVQGTRQTHTAKENGHNANKIPMPGKKLREMRYSAKQHEYEDTFLSCRKCNSNY